MTASDSHPPAFVSWIEVAEATKHLPAARHPSTLTLHSRQQDALIATCRAFQSGTSRPLVVLPTGVGKTILGLAVANRTGRTLFLTPGQTLMRQAQATASHMFPQARLGTIYGSQHTRSEHADITFSTIPTMYARHAQIPADDYDLIIFDECHHIAANTWMQVAWHFKDAKHLGLTATPERADGAPLIPPFERVVYEMHLQDAIHERLLVPPTVHHIQTSVNLEAAAHLGADFNAASLAKLIDVPARNALVVQSYLELATPRRALTFAVSVAHAQKLEAAFRERGVRASAVWGNDPQRRDKLAALRSGAISNLISPMLLTEGFDEPGVQALLCARPTTSRGLYTQMLGRGLRLAPNKHDCVVLDFVDVCLRFNLQDAWRVGGSAQTPGQHETQSRSRDAYARHQHYAGQLSYAHFIATLELLTPPPPLLSRDELGAWTLDPPSERQLHLLQRSGYDTTHTPWSKGQASQVIQNLPPSGRQAMLLLAHGFDIFSCRWTRSQAAQALHTAAHRTPDFALLETLIPQYRSFLHGV